MEHWSTEMYQKYIKNDTKSNKMNANCNKSTSKYNKYGAKRTNIDGHVFPSKKEANYYMELDLRLKAGDIAGFCIQPIFILSPGIKYIADFIIFNNDGTTEVVDTKGFRTQEYKLKKKLFENKYNLKIKEI